MDQIVLNHVTKQFTTKTLGTVTAVNDFNLTIKEGECFSFLGPSGCGKTTTLRMIAGFEDLSDGEIHLCGRPVSIKSKNLYVPPEERGLGMVFQSFAVWPHMNIFENVAFPLRVRKVPKAEMIERVKMALKHTSLDGMEKVYPGNLSGGQQQRIALARAIVTNPKVMLLDEPLSNLDPKLRETMRFEIKELQKKFNFTIIFVTHDQSEAMALSDRMMVMDMGNIVQIGTPTDIYNEPKNVFVAKFIGESNILPGTMKRDLLVNFHSMDFTCVDKGFAPNEPVDVVIRPEDIDLVAPDAGMLRGIVKSVLFMGVHYEFRVECGDVMLTVHSTDYVEPGCEVGVVILPDAIHIMHKSDAPDAAEPLPQEDLPEDTPELLPEE